MKRVVKFLIIAVVVLIVIVAFAAGYLLRKPRMVEIIIENPLNAIVAANTNSVGAIDVPAVIEQGVIEFDEEYINYLLVALGTGYLHKSIIGGNPILELVLEDETWNSEIIKGFPNSALGGIDNEDLRITISKEEAVKAILSSDITQFMKNSAVAGNIQLEMVAGYTELFAKGYLDMYNALTGEEMGA
tara:strand:+ start:345 stop:908 length:564 start_codon:yes stop_codon:yes gene_type:complete